MKRHTVESIMTKDVISVRPNASFKRIATLLAEHDIGAVPVTDHQDRVIGIVSEADLVADPTRSEPHRSRCTARNVSPGCGPWRPSRRT